MKIRKGKNIYFRLTVTLPDGSPEDFSNASDISIAISGKSWKYLPEVVLDKNVVRFQYPEDKNVYLGEFDIHLRYTKPSVISITETEPFYLDIVPAFTIVGSSAEEDFDESVENMEMVTVAVSGHVNIVGTNQDINENFEERLTSLENAVNGDGEGSVSHRISQAFIWEEHYKSNN